MEGEEEVEVSLSASAAASSLLLSRVLLHNRRLPSSSTDWQASTPSEQAHPVSLAVSQRETKAKRLPRSAAEAAERGEACVAGHVMPTEPAAARRNLAAQRPRGACLLASLRCVQQVDIQRSMEETRRFWARTESGGGQNV